MFSRIKMSHSPPIMKPFADQSEVSALPVGRSSDAEVIDSHLGKGQQRWIIINGQDPVQ